MKPTCNSNSSCQSSIPISTPTSTLTSTLLPILEPSFNIRECAKQMILLEDHLFNPGKRCADCCRKHMLTIEGLAEEAYSLDRDNKYTEDIQQIIKCITECEQAWKNNENPEQIAQHIRKVRKILSSIYF